MISLKKILNPWRQRQHARPDLSVMGQDLLDDPALSRMDLRQLADLPMSSERSGSDPRCRQQAKRSALAP